MEKGYKITYIDKNLKLSTHKEEGDLNHILDTIDKDGGAVVDVYKITEGITALLSSSQLNDVLNSKKVIL